MFIPPDQSKSPTEPNDSVNHQEIPDNEKKIEFAKFINDHNLQLINHTDTKTSIIVAINGVLLGLLFGSAHSYEYIYLHIVFIFIVVLLGASAVFGLLAILPRPAKGKHNADSMVYHETILGKDLKSMDSKEFYTYMERWSYNEKDLQSTIDLTTIPLWMITGYCTKRYVVYTCLREN